MITSIMAAVIYKLVTAAITLIGSYSLQTTLAALTEAARLSAI